MLSKPLTLWTMWEDASFFSLCICPHRAPAQRCLKCYPFSYFWPCFCFSGKERCLTNQDGPSLRWRRHFLDHLLEEVGTRGVLCRFGESHYGISCYRIHETLVPYINSHCLEESPSNYRVSPRSLDHLLTFRKMGWSLLCELKSCFTDQAYLSYIKKGASPSLIDLWNCFLPTLLETSFTPFYGWLWCSCNFLC